MAVDMGFDESGSHDILLVSVQVGVVQRAKKLKTAWKTILRENCVPYFHSVDYDNFDKGVFRHLDREAALEVERVQKATRDQDTKDKPNPKCGGQECPRYTSACGNES